MEDMEIMLLESFLDVLKGDVGIGLEVGRVEDGGCLCVDEEPVILVFEEESDGGVGVFGVDVLLVLH
jgi:hypothetical protein